ncbi:arylsulfatase [Rubripirellula reticaptiva]|uniref:Arylsulfatase n=1 Tax=Rubripirellula reticaptiva TaxID=2528013 RepID=A0A5C6FAR6_9BACT|nr:arylsulfatase [Rubripirellula reticaptiva]TWU57630.1 Arylsulfatase [Rubripirellula reticaptiva]
MTLKQPIRLVSVLLTRPAMVRWITLILLCTIPFSIFVEPVSGADSDSPNVIFILADDLGIGDLGCYGQQKLKTPNIDRLASEGLRFTDHYSGNTVCSPSRAVIMTGQHPGHVHCRGNGEENTFALDPKMITLPRMFKNAGYATGAFGKWGLGITSDSGNSNPLTHGFDHFSGWKSQRIAHTYFPSSIVRDGVEQPLQPGTFIHDMIVDDARQFIRSSVSAKTRFFCYIPTAVPHAAMHAPKQLHEKWRKVYPQFDGKIGTYGAGPDDDCPPVQNPIAGFAAMMENLDNEVGSILDLLIELGVDENTIVCFSSDNGSHLEGGHDPEFWDSNGPFRGHKRDLYEGGIRTPLLVRWPAKIVAGRTSDHISAFWDIVPTMAEITGQAVPAQVDGLSFLPTLLGDEESQAKHQSIYMEFIHGNAKPYSSRSLRMGDWKAVQSSEKKLGKQMLSIELYNLADDVDEQHDVAATNAALVEKMERYMDEAHRPLK